MRDGATSEADKGGALHSWEAHVLRKDSKTDKKLDADERTKHVLTVDVLPSEKIITRTSTALACIGVWCVQQLVLVCTQ